MNTNAKNWRDDVIVCAIWLRQRKKWQRWVSRMKCLLSWTCGYFWIRRLTNSQNTFQNEQRSSFACNKNSHSKKISIIKTTYCLYWQHSHWVYSKIFRMPLHWTINKLNVAKNSFEKSISILFDWKIARSQKKNNKSLSKHPKGQVYKRINQSLNGDKTNMLWNC